MKKRMQGKGMKLLLHFAAWAIMIGLPFYNFFRWNLPKEFIWTFYLIIAVNGMIFYVNYLVLIPKFFLKNKRVKYYSSAFLLVAAIFFLSLVSSNLIFEKMRRNEPDREAREDRIEQREDHMPDGKRRILRLPFGPMGIYNFAFNALVFTVFAFGLKALERNSEIEKRQKELEKEKLNSELAFLKNQISPHFFFNTLNNIYSLISINTEDSQEAVLKLSKMMRYLLYESEQGETRLSNEIEFMNNYVALMRLRLSEKVSLNISFPETYENISIPPLLFISIIENAFKHGISYREKSFIDIKMDVSKEMITFICENSLVARPETDINGATGIGLDNLKKRLGLLFPGRHELKIEKQQSVFRVSVLINLA
ncbi:MAG TPA: histidine kinase [Bacteroidales bacterium]|nr:histidine kinase [Bacteroidales bacterium]